MSRGHNKKKQFNRPKDHLGEMCQVIQPGLYWEDQLQRQRECWKSLPTSDRASIIKGSEVGEVAVKFPDKEKYRVMQQQCLLTSPVGFDEIRAFRGQREMTTNLTKFLTEIEDGYLYVWLPLHAYWKDKTIPVPLHQLVADLFVPYNHLCTDYDWRGNECLRSGLEVDHLDGDRMNNAASNLVFVPPEINKLWVGWDVEKKLELLRSPHDPYVDC